MKDDTKNLPPQVAVALQYDGKNAPKVTAKGEGALAERILQVAKDSDIPLHEDPILVQVLSQIDLDNEIPRNLYIAVAEVIAFAYILAGKICPLKDPLNTVRPQTAPMLNDPGIIDASEDQ